ncbi:MAG: hypothetical protein WCP12_10365 [bacterium]
MSESEEFLKSGTHEWDSYSTDEIRVSKKVLMVSASWIAGFLIATPDPRAFFLIPAFPIGITLVISKLMGQEKPPEEMLLSAGWFFYVGLTLAALAMTRIKWFALVWLFLTLVLVLNGVSCHPMINSLRNTH